MSVFGSLPVPIAGVQKVSLVDYPGRVCATVFLRGCNFRCPFCHNASLVDLSRGIGNSRGQRWDLEQLTQLLVSRSKFITAVTITGGEPTLHPQLLFDIAKAAKGQGYAVKLDTNGSNPEVVEQVLPYLDYVAVDIKHSPDKYCQAAGREVDIRRVERTLLAIRGYPHELRTTVVPGLHTPADIASIGKWVMDTIPGYVDTARENGWYVLQAFHPADTVLHPGYRTIPALTDSDIQPFWRVAASFFPRVVVRGVGRPEKADRHPSNDHSRPAALTRTPARSP